MAAALKLSLAGPSAGLGPRPQPGVSRPSPALNWGQALQGEHNLSSAVARTTKAPGTFPGLKGGSAGAPGRARAEASAVALPDQGEAEEASPAANSAGPETAEQSPAPEQNGAASASASPSSAPAKQAFKKLPPSVRIRRARDWERARELLRTGKVINSRVEGFNEGGARLRVGSLLAFLPFSQLEPRGTLPTPGANKWEGLVGKTVNVQVLEVDEKAGRLLVSQRKALRKLRLQQLQPGQVCNAVVTGVVDYGAFVDLLAPDGSVLGVGGLVHLSELSWDAVINPASVVFVGQNVRVKILHVEQGKDRLALSMKQVQSDPLLNTLDALLPSSFPAPLPGLSAPQPLQAQALAPSPLQLGPQPPLAEELLGAPLPGLQDLCDLLRRQEGITQVTLGRQAMERRVVSQDLELWLANIPVEDGQMTLVARAGRQVQEVFVKSTLDREGMKQAVLNVSRTIT